MSIGVEKTRLTDEDFWEHMWASVTIPIRISPRSSIERCLSRLFLRLIPDGRGKRFIEIGAAPGSWLVFFHEKLGYDVDGIEYIPSACRKTEENLASCKTPGTVFQQDFFFNEAPKHSYDVVLSLGFIEHFTDLDLVMTGHIALLKPGGILIIGVPNLRGINGLAAKLINPDNLTAHNLTVMNMGFMKHLSTRYQMKPLWMGYVGGIHPGLIPEAEDKAENISGFAAMLRRKGRGLLRFTRYLLSGIRNRITLLDHLNGSLISGYLLGIYQYIPDDNSVVVVDQKQP